MDIWETNKLLLFIAFVIPGFVTLKMYELLIPAEPKESSKQLIDAVAFSCINYALLFAPIYLVETYGVRAAHPLLYVGFYILVLLVAPAAWPCLWIKWRTTKAALRTFKHPSDKPWDYVFRKRACYWVIVTLKDGEKIAGLYGDESFSSTAPAPEQLYLQEAWHLNKDGGFDRARNATAGVIILESAVRTVELFKVD